MKFLGIILLLIFNIFCVFAQELVVDIYWNLFISLYLFIPDYIFSGLKFSSIGSQAPAGAAPPSAPNAGQPSPPGGSTAGSNSDLSGFAL